MGVLKDFDVNKVERSTVVDAQTDYNIIRSGCSYAGFCGNASCPANKKYVVCNRGYGSFLVNDDVMSAVPKCPRCKSTFELRNVCLFQCRATVTIHDHQEQTATYKVQGEEVVKLGSKMDLKINPHALMSIETKPLSAGGRGDCVIS
eukprot:TRINITY_DN18874_c3_g1_i3.p2 TRINITY_DN18874_c3_g1~~TRINITY_DN18874_c3_g1_i3.p2  ORF type:complete len:147 (+),score=59.71 TRINITY_DN18874_c3_g1_i3:171-611(+)